MSVQRVVVTRTGGFAGITVTTEVADPADAQRLADAIRGAVDRPAGQRRDDFVYEFTVQTETATDRIRLTGAQLPAEVRTLIERNRPR